MKKLVLMFAVLAFVVVACNKGGAPKEVTAKFTETYADTKAEWAKQEDGNWLATFKFEEMDWTALFAPDGTWIESVKATDEAGFPVKAVEYLKLFYADMTPTYKFMKNADGEFNVAEMMKEEQAMKVLFSAEGSVVKDESNPIIAKFTEAYPTATEVAWSKMEEDFLANFLVDGKAWKAVFAKDGVWKYSESVVAAEEIPGPVADYFKKLKGFEQKDALMTKTPEKTTYTVNGTLLKKTFSFIFDDKGVFVEKKEVVVVEEPKVEEVKK